MRSDLLCYEKYICYVTNEAIYMVTRNDVGSFDLLTIDRAARIENLVISVERYADEDELIRVIPFAAGMVGGSRLSPRFPDPEPPAQPGAKQIILQKAFSAYGIAGFVRFLYGYYVLIITGKSQVATIGHHAVFEIDRIEAIYIPVPQIGINDANEIKYLKTFQNVDLTKNFYLSYTYDMTRTLQSWLDGPESGIPFENSYDPKFTWNSYLFAPLAARLDDAASKRWILSIVHGFVGQGNVNIFGRHVFITLIARRSRHFAGTRYLKRGISTEGYVANEVEIEQIVFENPTLALSKGPDLKSKTLLTDGFGLCSSFVQLRGSVPALWTQDTSSMSMVGPPPISVFGYDLGMLLAGRHFSQLLSRYGAPIVVLDLVKTHQKTGSKRNVTSNVPSASAATVMSITSNMTVNNPNAAAKNGAANAQFISPSEAQKEALLQEVLSESVAYLNQFLEPDFRMQYIHIDLAHLYRKDPTGAVTVRRLLDIGDRYVLTCGICTVFTGQRQKGVLRTNCVDCLDRTNAAQLAAGFVALGLQFHALGAIAEPSIELDCYCFRLFELLFEEMGDVLAVQYGGSLLVHHFATYRRAIPWISQSRDKLEQVSRLLNNTFSDADRQHGTNLLLGMYRPYQHHRVSGTVVGVPIWDLASDYDLHNSVVATVMSDAERRRRLVQWFDIKVLKCLPLPAPITDEDSCSRTLTVSPASGPTSTPSSSFITDTFTVYFQPNKMTFFEDMHDFKIPSTLQLTPAGGILLPDTDLDPFIPRVRRIASSSNASNVGAGSLLRRFLQHSATEIPQGPIEKMPPVAVPIKQPSSEALDSSTIVAGGPSSDADSEDSQEGEKENVSPDSFLNQTGHPSIVKSPWPSTNFSTVFKSQLQLYGVDISAKLPNETDTKLFNTYCYMTDFRPIAGIAYTPVTIVPISGTFRSDIDFLNAAVPAASVRIYEAYVQSSPNNGAQLWQPDGNRLDEYIAYMRSGVAF